MTATWSTGGFLACSPPCMAVSRAHQGQPSAIKRHHCRIYYHHHHHHHHDLVRWLPEELLFRRCKAAGGEKQQKKGNAVHPSSIFFPPPLFRPILRPISESDFHAGDDRPLLFLSLWSPLLPSMERSSGSHMSKVCQSETDGHLSCLGVMN